MAACTHSSASILSSLTITSVPSRINANLFALLTSFRASFHCSPLAMSVWSPSTSGVLNQSSIVRLSCTESSPSSKILSSLKEPWSSLPSRKIEFPQFGVTFTLTSGILVPSGVDMCPVIFPFVDVFPVAIPPGDSRPYALLPFTVYVYSVPGDKSLSSSYSELL